MAGLTLKAKYENFTARLQSGEFTREQYEHRMERLERSTVKGVIQMWDLLGRRYITDPRPTRMFIEGTYEEGYHIVFFDLNSVTDEERSIIDVLESLRVHYGKEPFTRWTIMDGFLDAFGYSKEEAQEELKEVLEVRGRP